MEHGSLAPDQLAAHVMLRLGGWKYVRNRHDIDELYVLGSQELDHATRVAHYRKAQEIAAENVPLIYTSLAERLTATRNVFGNSIPTLYALWDIRHLYRTDH